jgi:single-strand DNA-binding protein
MEITGRVTANAKVNNLQDDRQVVHFTIAINDYYKPKGSTEGKQLTTYINCSYWISSRIAERLTKGALVQSYGRIGVQAYNDMDGNARASLTFHCNTIKILATTKTNSTGQTDSDITDTDQQQYSHNPEVVDDLPF